jgi:voltage-gated potassium channel
MNDDSSETQGQPAESTAGGPTRGEVDPTWRGRLHTVIFEAETPAGKTFDVFLIVLISLSVLTVLLDSVQQVSETYEAVLVAAEWCFTVLFTIEYGLRLLCFPRPARYAFSFFGMVDLLAIVPTYLTLLYAQTHYFALIRVLRVLRVFRVLKLAHHVSEANLLMRALYASRRKLSVFLYAVLTLVILLASLMYLIEGEENGFTSIPKSMYWTIVTLTTVGFGDVTPQTPIGQALAAVIMLIGFGIIAVPFGIITAELTTSSQHSVVSTEVCRECSREGHDADADYCKYCGTLL